MTDSIPTRSLVYPTRVILLAAAIFLAVLGIVAAVVYATDIMLILFLAILFGVFLARMSQLLMRFLPLSYGVSLSLVTTCLVACTAIGVGLFGVQVNQQIEEASQHVDKAQLQIEKLTHQYPVLRSVIKATPFVGELVNGTSDVRAEQEKSATQNPPQNDNENNKDQGDSSSKDASPMLEQTALQNTARQGVQVIGGMFKTTFGLLVNSMLIFFVGLFLACNPKNYREGVVVLFPQNRRERVREIMSMMGNTLWKWLIGRFGSMLVTGGGAALLLLSLGVPMAMSLGVVTALLAFIPNLGGFLALLLAILFALPQGGVVVGLVFMGYLLLQLIESYVITPLIEKQQVSIPPALLIAFQAIMGVLFGILGAAVASPLLAVAKLGIEEAYVKDVLESGSAEQAST